MWNTLESVMDPCFSGFFNIKNDVGLINNDYQLKVKNKVET